VGATPWRFKSSPRHQFFKILPTAKFEIDALILVAADYSRSELMRAPRAKLLYKLSSCLTNSKTNSLRRYRRAEMSDHRNVGPPKCRTTEMSDHRNVGPPKCRTTETPDRQSLSAVRTCLSLSLKQGRSSSIKAAEFSSFQGICISPKKTAAAKRLRFVS
jgi:hypothetical protein